MAEITKADILRAGKPLKVIDGATATGLDGTRRFILPQKDMLELANLTLQHIPTGSFTTLTFDIEISLDGGITFSLIASWDAVANPASRNDLGLTGIYRLNVTGFVGGTAVDVLAAVP